MERPYTPPEAQNWVKDRSKSPSPDQNTNPSLEQAFLSGEKFLRTMDSQPVQTVLHRAKNVITPEVFPAFEQLIYQKLEGKITGSSDATFLIDRAVKYYQQAKETREEPPENKRKKQHWSDEGEIITRRMRDVIHWEEDSVAKDHKKRLTFELSELLHQMRQEIHASISDGNAENAEIAHHLRKMNARLEEGGDWTTLVDDLQRSWFAVDSILAKAKLK